MPYNISVWFLRFYCGRHMFKRAVREDKTIVTTKLALSSAAMLFFGELLSTLMRVYGSVVPRCLMVSVLGAIEGVLLREYVIETSDGEQQSFWQHPYSLAIFGTVLGFSL
eukprot:4269079-Prymnesium_polylepis.1